VLSISHFLLLRFVLIDLCPQRFSWLVVGDLECTKSLWLECDSLEAIFVLGEDVVLGNFVLSSGPLQSFLVVEWVHALQTHFLYLVVAGVHSVLVKVQVVSELFNIYVMGLGCIVTIGIDYIIQIIKSHQNLIFCLRKESVSNRFW